MKLASRLVDPGEFTINDVTPTAIGNTTNPDGPNGTPTSAASKLVRNRNTDEFDDDTTSTTAEAREGTAIVVSPAASVTSEICPIVAAPCIVTGPITFSPEGKLATSPETVRIPLIY